MEFEILRRRLDDIYMALDTGRYHVGMWQRWLRDAESLPVAEKKVLSPSVSLVSRKLHSRHRFPRVPFGVALIGEFVLLAAAMVLLSQPTSLVKLIGVAALALSLQPTIKILAGLVLGVRYDYAFLWYFEPRFKMSYGTYFLLTPGRRVWFHLAGSIGTPLALLIGFISLAGVNLLLAWGCLALSAGAAIMQVGAFAAQWMGVRKVGGFQLATLTSPATAAYEWKRMRTGH